MTGSHLFLKRTFDILFALTVLVLLGWVMLLSVIAATLDTGSFGIFRQHRIGRGGRAFRIFKVRTMRELAGVPTNVTVRHDPRITRMGGWLRRFKIDELPQFLNVLAGQMSVVGPRPDVPGFADQLEGEERLLLSVRPGVTGPAALVFRDEEELLAGVANPERFSDEVLWPLKVELNLEYIKRPSIMEDVRLIVDTVFPRPGFSTAVRNAELTRNKLTRRLHQKSMEPKRADNSAT